ncbi:unnamed protein product [Rhodiola kirilowii]
MSSDKGKDLAAEGSSRSYAVVPSGHGGEDSHGQISQPLQQAQPALSRYESQKRRDWNTFCQYLRNQRPPVSIHECNSSMFLTS